MFFFQGLTMGLAYVAPIGMQNLFVIHSAFIPFPAPRRRDSAHRPVLRHQSVAELFLRHRQPAGSSSWLKAVILGAGTLLILYMPMA